MDRDEYYSKPQTYCSRCGQRVIDNRCTGCGKKYFKLRIHHITTVVLLLLLGTSIFLYASLYMRHQSLTDEYTSLYRNYEALYDKEIYGGTGINSYLDSDGNLHEIDKPDKPHNFLSPDKIK